MLTKDIKAEAIRNYMLTKYYSDVDVTTIETMLEAVQAIYVNEESVTIRKEALEKIKSLLVSADSLISLLHHRGHISYKNFGCPAPDEVETLYKGIRTMYESFKSNL